MVLAFLAFAVTLSLVALIWRRNARPKHFPPGPLGLPFVGSVFSLGKKPQLTILKWKEKYGDTFSFHSGTKLHVVLSDFYTVRKVFGEHSAAGRQLAGIVRAPGTALPIEHGLVGSEGHKWKIHRRFALSTLRDLGMGKNWLEDSIVEEVAEILHALRDKNGKPFDPRIILKNGVSNVICALAFGKRSALTDPKFSRLTSLISENITTMKLDYVAQTFPFLMWFPNTVRNKLRQSCRNNDELKFFVEKTVEEHKTANSSEAVEDFLFAYQKEKANGTKTEAQDIFDDKQLMGSLVDLFGAGTETTSTTVLWAMVFMTENPGVVKIAQDEIDSIFGRERMLTSADRALLPYTEAFVLEVQRCANIFPLAIPHRTHEEIEVDGYILPKGTTIIANLFSIQRDTRWWKDPLKFDPARFLDENRKLLKPDGFVPFSIGKRACMGESLAKMELFLFIANILRCFSLLVPQGKTVSHENYFASLVTTPDPFELIFVPRN